MLVVQDKVDWKKAVDVPLRAWADSAGVTLEEFKEVVVDMSSQQCDFVHHSKPGNYPFRETGDFINGLSTGELASGSTAGGLASSAKAFALSCKVIWGRWLQEGRGRMKPRPWFTLALAAEDWFGRLAELARSRFGRS